MATSTAMEVPWRLNLALAGAVLSVYAAFFEGRALLAAGHVGVFAVTLVAFVALTPTLWGLIHEGIHGRIVPGLIATRTTSRVLSVLLGFSFDAVQFGHLMHHRYNGHEHDRPNRIKPGEPAWASWFRHCLHLFGGHYLFTTLVGAVSFAPARLRNNMLEGALAGDQPDIAAMRRGALKWCADSQRLMRIRIDFATSILLLVITFAHYGPYWPALLLGWYGRAFLYSTLDNLPHYGMGGRGDASAKNLTLHPALAVMVLNHNLHRLHHERPNLPWRSLSAHRTETPTDGDYFMAGLRQFTGPTRT
jgi:fatty acid desaturase